MNKKNDSNKTISNLTGLSLPMSYATGGKTDKNELFSGWFGKAEGLLTELKSAGLQSVELQGLQTDLQNEDILAALELVASKGLGLTFHTHLPEWKVGNPVPQFSAPDARVIDMLRHWEIPPIAVVHAYSERELSWDVLVRRSVEAIRAMLDFHREHDVNLKIALEINRYKGAIIPGVKYEGILEISDYFEEDALGLCWDMGHTQSSIQQEQLPFVPPQDFTTQVIHTHIHELGANGRTHFPVDEQSTYIKSGIQRLKANKYQGAYNLELYPQRWSISDKVEIKAAVVKSIETVRSLAN